MFEKRVREKIAQLIERADAYGQRPPGGRDEQWVADGRAWIAEAINIVQLALPDPLQTYRLQIRTASILGTAIERVLTIASMLRSLLADVDAGLVGTITNKVRAETFDNFLDHAIEYRNENRKEEAGAIAGVVFEDTVRKIYADKIGGLRGQLEDVINALAKKEVITGQQAKQAKVAAHIRTKATHALWDEFTLEGVDDTIRITKAFIREHLE